MTETLTKKVENFNTARKNNKGFSLVELIIVIAIIAILAAVLAPQFIRFLDDAEISTDIAKATNIETVINTLFASNDIEFDPTDTDPDTFVWDVDAGTITVGAGITGGSTDNNLGAAIAMFNQLNIDGTTPTSGVVPGGTPTDELQTQSSVAVDVTWTISRDANGIVSVRSDVDYGAWDN